MQINNYLYNYLLNIKNDKVKGWYESELDKKYNIKKFFKDKNSLCRHALNGNIAGLSKCGQFGGQMGGADTIDKLSKIKTLFDEYKRLPVATLEKNMSSINEQVDMLMKEVGKADIGALNPDKVLNNLEVMKINLKDLKDGVGGLGKMVEINAQKLNLNLKLPMDANEEGKGLNVFKQIIQSYRAELDKFGGIMVKNDAVHAKNINELEKQIDTTIVSITEKINSLSEFLSYLKKTLASNDFASGDNDGGMVSILPSFTSLYDQIIAMPNDAIPKAQQVAFKKFKDRLQGAKRERDRIDIYNEEIKQFDVKIKDLPFPFFDGTYVVRINNNLLRNPQVMDIKTDLIRQLIKDGDYSLLYKLPQKSLSVAQVQVQSGGATEKDVIDKVSLLESKLNQYNALINDYVKEANLYNTHQMDLILHSLFLVLVTTNKIYPEGGYIIFNYINKGLLQFYKRIVQDILTRIKNGDTSAEITYMRKFHFVTLGKLDKFLPFVYGKLKTPENVVDIGNCTGKIKQGFHLLNHFKDILDDYKRIFLGKITIYARINDWAGMEDRYNDKMFLSDQEVVNNNSGGRSEESVDPTALVIRRELCPPLPIKTEEVVHFTEVYDTKNYPTTETISKSMTMETYLSEGKGMALMTYGYSGTGKTFTLFGKTGDSTKEGILQSTLNNIRGLTQVQFRLFELHGYGVSYPHYWKGGVNEYAHSIIHYQLATEGRAINFISRDERDWERRVSAIEFNNYIKDSKTRITIGESSVKDTFKSFSDLMEKVEGHRQKNERVRETPNNPVSSRSMLVYDFILTINGKDVPFVIMDLPGREEILQTYVETFVDPVKNPLFAKAFGDAQHRKLIRNMLATMALNPLALSLYDARFVYDTLSKWALASPENFADVKKIYEGKLLDKYKQESDGGADEEGKGAMHSLIDEWVNGKGLGLNIWFKYDGKTITFTNIGGSGFGYEGINNKNREQYWAVLSLHIMNRLIRLNRFDIIKHIFEKFCEKHVNGTIQKYIRQNMNNVATLSADLKTYKAFSTIPLNPSETFFYDKFKYDYYLTPFEGIYINENIIGIAQYISTKCGTKSGIVSQDSLSFAFQQKRARMWLITKQQEKQKVVEFFGLPANKYETPMLTYSVDNDKFDILNSRLDEEYGKMLQTYKSDKIFNRDEPLITRIMDEYFKKINDYKIFYLFSNVNLPLKCSHQYKLLDDTRTFIANINKCINNK